MKLKREYILLLSLGYASINAVHHAFETRLAPKELTRPKHKVSIVLPLKDEPNDSLKKCLDSLKGQTVVKAFPEMFELIIVESGGVDLNLCRRYASKIVHSPLGKLTARHIGVERAEGDIIASADGDSIYSPQWLQLHLEKYSDLDVVATHGSTDQGVLELLFSMPKHLIYMSRLSARNSTFLKSAYREVGGFNLKVNQLNPDELLYEEEFNFFQKLRRIGKIAYVPLPVVHLNMRKRGLVHRKSPYLTTAAPIIFGLSLSIMGWLGSSD